MSAELTADRATADRTTVDRTTADRTTADRTTADRTTADRTTADRTTADRATADRTTADRATAVRFEDVSFAYGELPVLAAVGFDLAPAEVVHLAGRSGSGKSTLLRLAHGQLRPRTGRVVVDGTPVHRAGGGALRGLRRRVAMVPQDSGLLPRLTALENVAYALRVADLRLSPGEAARRARAVLCEVGLEDRLTAMPHRLSAGQRLRVAVARAVASAPAVVLADEPTASLDPEAAAAVMGLFERLARSGAAVLLATTDGDLPGSARRRGGRVLRLDGGALVDDHGRNSTCAAG